MSKAKKAEAFYLGEVSNIVDSFRIPLLQKRQELMARKLKLKASQLSGKPYFRVNDVGQIEEIRWKK